MLKFIPMLFLGLLLLSFVYVTWSGRWPERIGLFVIIVGSMVTALVGQSHLWKTTELGIFAVDVLVLAAFVMILGLTNRFWPIWVTAFQIISVMAHLSRLLKPFTIPIAYAVAEQLWSYVMIVLIVWSVHYQRSFHCSKI